MRHAIRKFRHLNLFCEASYVCDPTFLIAVPVEFHVRTQTVTYGKPESSAGHDGFRSGSLDKFCRAPPLLQRLRRHWSRKDAESILPHLIPGPSFHVANQCWTSNPVLKAAGSLESEA